MKTIDRLLLCLLLATCAACTTPAPAPPQPPEPPTPPIVVVGDFIIRSYDVNGNIKTTYEHVKSYKETRFPRSVTFQFGKGQIVTLTGSYEISQPR